MADDEEFKARRGKLSYLRASLEAARTFEANEARLTVDGAQPEVRAANLVVGNCRYAGGGWPASPNANPEDGLSDLVVVEDVGLAEQLSLASKALACADYGENEGVFFARGREIRIETEPAGVLEFNADGELVGQGPAEFTVVPRALKVVGPGYSPEPERWLEDPDTPRAASEGGAPASWQPWAKPGGRETVAGGTHPGLRKGGPARSLANEDLPRSAVRNVALASRDRAPEILENGRLPPAFPRRPLPAAPATAEDDGGRDENLADGERESPTARWRAARTGRPSASPGKRGRRRRLRSGRRVTDELTTHRRSDAARPARRPTPSGERRRSRAARRGRPPCPRGCGGARSGCPGATIRAAGPSGATASPVRWPG